MFYCRFVLVKLSEIRKEVQCPICLGMFFKNFRGAAYIFCDNDLLMFLLNYYSSSYKIVLIWLYFFTNSLHFADVSDIILITL